MKRISFILVIILTLNLISSVYAQKDEPIINLEHMDKKNFQWGYYFGANYLDFKFDLKELKYDPLIKNKFKKDIQIKKRMGFNVGLMGSARIMDNIHVRIEPGLIYNQRDLYFPGFKQEEENKYIREVRSTYLYFPLLVKFSTDRWFNFKPYVIGGASATYNLSSSSDFKDDNSEGRFRMNDFTFFYEFGVGIDFYTPYFRISPSIRGLFSLGNEIIKDNNPNSPWTGNINSMRTQGFLINITLE